VFSRSPIQDLIDEANEKSLENGQIYNPSDIIREDQLEELCGYWMKNLDLIQAWEFISEPDDSDSIVGLVSNYLLSNSVEEKSNIKDMISSLIINNALDYARKLLKSKEEFYCV
jgi:hypothetical protein